MNSPVLPPSPHLEGSQRRLDDLRQELHALADEQRRLQHQIATLAESLEALAAGTQPSPALKVPYSPSLPRRIAKFLLRKVMETVRRLWQLGAPKEELFTVEVSTSVATHLPTFTLVMLDLSPQEAQGVAEGLARGSVPMELVLWQQAAGGVVHVAESGEKLEHSGTAPDLAALRQQIQGDYVASLTREHALQHLPSTALEVLRWALAAEGLDWIELCSDFDARAGRLCFVRRRLWHPTQDFMDSTFGRSSHALGKVIHFPQGAGGRPLGDPTRRRFHPLGKNYLRHGPQPKHHVLKPLHQLPVSPENSDSKGTLLLLNTPLVAGSERWLSDLLRSWGSERLCAIACLLPSHRLQKERILALESLARRVYPLGDLLAAKLLDSALPTLVRRENAHQILHFGEKPLSEAARQHLPQSVDCVDFLLHAAGDLPCGIDLDVFNPQAITDAQRMQFRQQFGLDDGQILVTQAADLIAEQRPEDFVALAHALREDSRFVFLLVGRGPRTASLGDLLHYLAPPQFHLVDNAPWIELLAASDVVVSTAERQPLPYFLLAAMACGRPVVAAQAPGLDELLTAGVHFVPVGQSTTMAEALRALEAPAPRRDLGEQGRALVESQFSLPSALAAFNRRLEGRSVES